MLTEDQKAWVAGYERIENPISQPKEETMSFEHKPGNFNLFKNDKDGNDKRPDYRGEGTDLQGNKVELAAWIKDGAKGKFMSVTMKTKTAQSTQASRPNEKPSNDFEDDRIPF